jgi:AcrR family transcriptional regulator
MADSAPLSGRKAQAARNDQLIMASARAVFVADPSAPIAAVAEHAGVGISALYRRFASKEELLRHLSLDGLRRYIAVTERALAALDEGADAWQTFVAFMHGIVEEDTHSLTLRLAGTFTPTEELMDPSMRAQSLNHALWERLQGSGVLRADLDINDLSFIFEQIASVRVGDEARTSELRRRYLALHLRALRAPDAPADASPIPGPPPAWEELEARWNPTW